eukprot:5386490-Prymnesium_polylepis.1
MGLRGGFKSGSNVGTWDGRLCGVRTAGRTHHGVRTFCRETVFLSHLCNSLTLDVTNENSSDLDVGRRPKLKSEEFSFVHQGLTSYSHFCV